MPMMTPLYHVDAFTNQPFSGNPAAVCVLPEPADPAWMQNLALDMNLSETAFVHPIEGGFGLRWFTPTVEVALCGHATLASAHVLWEDRGFDRSQPIRFHTKSGWLICTQEPNGISMDFPSKPLTPADPPPGLLESLGVRAVTVGSNKMDYLVEVESEAVVRAAAPDFKLLATVDARGVIVTARSDSEDFDFVSRFFAPAAGVDEDPVTGSAHCALGPYWSAKLGKAKMTARQLSARGGTVTVRVESDRTHLGGQAVTVATGELWV